MKLCAIGVFFICFAGSDLAYERLVMQHVPFPTEMAMRHVQTIAMHDDTALTELARKAGVAGVDLSRNQTLRGLHGKFMERLADSGARVVAFDIGFKDPASSDADFLKGVEALKQKGTRVVVGGGPWKPNPVNV